MKTIEERATEYAHNNPFGHPYNWNAHHDGYKDGATEQKAIDHSDGHLHWIVGEWFKWKDDNGFFTFEQWIGKAMEE